MSEPKAVIFDWGGVLMRTEDRSLRDAWDQRLGLSPGSVEAVVHGIPKWRDAQLGLSDLTTYWSEVAQELKLSSEMLAQLQAEFYQGDVLDQNLVALIRRFKQEGFRTGLLSNNILDLFSEIGELGLSDVFDQIVISADIGVMKPAAAAYLKILDALGVAPENAAFVDDFPQNVEGARAVGMHGILFSPDLELDAALRRWVNEHES
jgi:epoxide hydrolase-like predicted phosphatase